MGGALSRADVFVVVPALEGYGGSEDQGAEEADGEWGYRELEEAEKMGTS